MWLLTTADGSGTIVGAHPWKQGLRMKPAGFRYSPKCL